MDTCKPCATLCKPNTSVFLAEGELVSEPTQYRNLVGALQYLIFTRPDIAFAVNNVCQFMNALPLIYILVWLNVLSDTYMGQ